MLTPELCQTLIDFRLADGRLGDAGGRKGLVGRFVEEDDRADRHDQQCEDGPPLPVGLQPARGWSSVV